MSTTTTIFLGGIFMIKANSDIRAALKSAKVPIWACAAEMGVHENTLLRKLRFELSEEDKGKFIQIINEIAEKNNTSR